MSDVATIHEPAHSAALTHSPLLAMIEQWPGTVLLFDAGARLLWCNEDAMRLAASSSPDLTGHTFDELRMPFQLSAEHFASALAGVPLELDGPTPDASLLQATSVDDTVAPPLWRVRLRRIDLDSERAALLCIAEARRTPERNRTIEEHEQAFDAAQAGIWRWNLQNGEASVDEAWCRHHQLDASVGANHMARWCGQIHPDDSPEYRRRLEGLRSGGSAYFEAEYRILTQDGRWLWILQRGRVVARSADKAPMRVIGICIDIDQRKREETTSKSNESKLATALWGARAAFWQWHLPTDVRTMSPMWYAMTRYTREQWDTLRNPWISRVHPEDVAAVVAAVEAYQNGKTDSLEYEYRLQTANAEYKWILDRARAVEWELEGKPAVIMGVSLDIDAQKRAEVELRTSEARLQTAVWGARMGLWEMELELDSIRWLDNWCEQYGIEACNGAGHYPRWLARIHPADAEGAQQRYQAYLAGQQDYYDAEYRVMTKSGLWRWLYVRARVTSRDESGRPRRMVGVCMDVDARRQEQMQEHFTQPWLETALSVARGAMWHWQIEPEEVTYTDTYYRLVGVDPMEGRKQPNFWSEHVHPEDLPRARQGVWDAVEGRTASYELEYRMRCADGRWIWVLDHARALVRDESSGKALRMVGFVMDITQRRAERQALRASQKIFRLATQAARGMMYEYDYEQGEGQRFGCELLVGYRHEELGRPLDAWLSLMHPDDVPRFLAARPLDKMDGHVEPLDFRLKHKDGHWVHVRDHGISLAGGDGRPRRRVGFVQEVLPGPSPMCSNGGYVEASRQEPSR